ncbi:hypothetical protein B0H15DRAFT_807804 [Mycena belliarum]|uniref:Uncharacterized protein n=1 Tax=Mycena belliarum TaxID=1033014 RepID=A0AAD6TLD3_9AGAR|nr:hypothetical protein B0H15DRAFT_807804 [Mycena belliae]
MQSTLTAAQIQAGTCPDCHKRLPPPLTSTGFREPDNAGRQYQYCPGNNFKANRTCAGFWFRDDLPRTVLPPSQWSQSCAGPLCSAPNAVPKPRNRVCARLFCLTCCVAGVDISCKAPHHSPKSMDPLLPRLPPRTTFSNPVSPAYADRMDQNIAAQTEVGARTAVKNSLRVEIQHRLTVFWFLKASLYQSSFDLNLSQTSQDNEPPSEFEIACPTFPFFHPKNDKTLVRMVGLEDCETYGYHNGTAWKITGLAQELKAGITILWMCWPHVRACSYGETPSSASDTSPRKRSLPSPIDMESSPPKRFQFTYPNPNRSVTPDEEYRSSPPPSSSPVPSLPVKPIWDVAPTTQHTPLSLVDAPEGPHRPWPLKYACDMDSGFHQITELRGSFSPAGPKFTTETAFHATFVNKGVSSQHVQPKYVDMGVG